jgi:Ca2+-binding EF-hand superfamily protein
MLAFGLEFTEEEVNVLIKTIDRNGDGVVDEQEYI